MAVKRSDGGCEPWHHTDRGGILALSPVVVEEVTVG